MLAWPILVDTSAHEVLVQRMRHPDSRPQLIVGPGGVGKSTLAAAVVSSLEEEGMTALPVVALAELSSVPLAAMAPALAKIGGRAPDALGERLQHLFSRIASDAPRYVLVVDDAGLLDDVSASMVYQLVRVAGVRCILTTRTDTEVPGPIDRLIGDGLVDVTRFAGVSTGTATRLVESALGGRVEPDSLRRLLKTAGGNALFLRELVLGARERNAIMPGPRGFTIDHSVLPARLREGISSRFAVLTPEQRTVVELIAVAEPLPEEMLDRHAAVVELEELELVRRSDDHEVFLAHPLVTEVLLAEMSRDRLDARRVEAAGLFVVGSDDSLRFKVDALLAETSAPPSAAELVWAARYAHAMTDQALAVKLAEMSLSQESSFDALLVRAAALSSMNAESAEVSFTDAEDAASSDVERARVVREWSQFHAIRLQRPRDAIVRELAELGRVVDPDARTLLQADLDRWRLVVGDAPFAEPGHDTGADPMTALLAIIYEVIYLAQGGRFSEAQGAIDRARASAADLRLVFPSAEGMLDLFQFRVTLYERGLLAASEFVVQRRPDPFGVDGGTWSYCEAVIALHVGRVDQAAVRAEQAVEQLRWRDPSGLLGAAEALRATLAAQAGRRAVALASLEAPPSGDVKETLQRVETEAWLHANDGDRAAAGAVTAAAGARAIQMHAHALAAPTLYLAVRLGEATRVLDSLRVIGETAEGAFIRSMVDHAEAAAARDGDALLLVAPRLADMGLLAGAVDAASQAAQLFRASGQGEKERKAELQRAHWSSRVPGYRPVSAGRDSFELTAREWAVARSAAGRHRSKEIAAQLGVSVRTVDNHLTSVYRKLGIASRDELRRDLEDLLPGASD